MGEYCRYDGKTKKHNALIEAFKEYEIIPFCPEAPLFGTPRERISVVEVEGEIRIITDETEKDVTLELQKEIENFCTKNSEVDAIVLKSKSPSCGNGTTPILNTKREVIRVGDGIATQIFKEKYENIVITDEIK